MKAKLLIYLVIALLLVAALWIAGKSTSREPERRRPSGKVRQRDDRLRTRGFRREEAYLAYTAHARCRMQCRHISVAEVRDILRNGTINYRKTDLNDRPCPTYALEGYTLQDNQHVRIVFAQCRQQTKVVTCIDLDNDNDIGCDCR